ncbi:MAG TPA: arylesterase [Bdellovibrionales bacterium]|nr:arylesterase [Bdellovibrionales bacterium]
MKTIVFIGDSLTAGYGVKKEEGYPERVETILRSRGKSVKIINGGISGSVSAEADARVKWFLKTKPQLIVLALGANDGLKGTPVAVIEKNLESAILLAKENKVPVVLVGMRMVTNLGPEYGKNFEGLYARLAKKHSLPFYPFLLDGVALNRELNQSDMKHPNAKGHEVIAKKMADFLEKEL